MSARYVEIVQEMSDVQAQIAAVSGYLTVMLPGAVTHRPDVAAKVDEWIRLREEHARLLYLSIDALGDDLRRRVVRS